MKIKLIVNKCVKCGHKFESLTKKWYCKQCEKIRFKGVVSK